MLIYALYDNVSNVVIENSIRTEPELIARLWTLYEIGEPERYEIVRGYDETPDELS